MWNFVSAFFSLSTMFSAFIHAGACISSAFLFRGWIIFYHVGIPYYGDQLSIYHLMKICLIFLAINVGVKNTCVHIFAWINSFSYFECKSRNRISRLYGDSMFDVFIWPGGWVESYAFFNCSIEYLHLSVEHYIYPSI